MLPGQILAKDPHSEDHGLLHKLMSALSSMCLATELPRKVVFARGRPLLHINAFVGFVMPIPPSMTLDVTQLMDNSFDISISITASNTWTEIDFNELHKYRGSLGGPPPGLKFQH